MQLTYIQQDGSPPIGDGGDQYTGLDRFGRVVDQRWMKESSGADLERVQYGFDRASNRVWRANPVAEALSANQDELYTYDGLNQLLTLQRGTLNSTKTGITGTPTWEEDLTFDPTGNWNNYVNLVNGTMTLNQPRTHNPVNEIVTISGSSALMVQDGAGNMIKAPKVSDWSNANAMIYDAWNRLVKVLDGGMTVAAYGYDGQNRRTTKAVGTTTRHYYYSSQWQILEERLNAATTADRQFVWGLMGIDNLILRDWGSERLYSIQDVFNSTAVVDANGTVQERYGYNAFGLSRVMDADFNPLSSSGYDWETRYASYRFDDESNFYQVRNRYLHPNLGRWLTRDQMEYGDGTNLYSYVSNNPAAKIDPSGLDSKCTCGLEVSLALKRTYLDVIHRFNLLSRNQKEANCQPFSASLLKILNDPALKLRASTGWDIYDLVWGWSSHIQTKKCGQGQQCYESVEVSGQCYWAWDVNYVLYGWLNNLCEISETKMLIRIFLWKTIGKGGKDPVGPPKAWAKVGYSQWPILPTTLPAGLPKFKNCTTGCGTYPNRSLNSTWPNASWTGKV